MEKVKLGNKDCIAPDHIHVRAWGYRIGIIKQRNETFSFDGESIHVSPTIIHNTIHENLETHDLLDFRYFYGKNLLSVWVYDETLIVLQLRRFEKAYRNGSWKPFDIDEVQLIFTCDGYAVKCLFSELDGISGIDANSNLRAYHVAPPSLKRLVTDESWRHGYFLESERVWVARHGNVDPACYHLLMYEE